MKINVSVISVVVVSFTAGCGVGHIESAPTSTGASAEALATSQNCVDQAKQCIASAKTDEDRQACQADARACVTALIPDNQAPANSSGATAPTIPLPALPDAGAPIPPISITPPSLPTDGGNVSLPDAGGQLGELGACLLTLKDCLRGATAPTACAQQVRDCIEAAL